MWSHMTVVSYDCGLRFQKKMVSNELVSIVVTEQSILLKSDKSTAGAIVPLTEHDWLK